MIAAAAAVLKLFIGHLILPGKIRLPGKMNAFA
jgi:hypothetical protein